MKTVLDTILNTKLIAIARGLYGKSLMHASKALYDGGVRVFEVTFEYDNDNLQTTDAITQLHDNLPSDAVIGVGTVLTQQQLNAAHAAGARFAISPNVNCNIINATKSLGMVSIPGALTPSEIVTAYNAGADIVKVFPAGTLGIEYFKAVKAPLKHIPMAAVAGINIQNIRQFADAGAVAFGISTGLYKKDSIRDENYAALTAMALGYANTLES